MKDQNVVGGIPMDVLLECNAIPMGFFNRKLKTGGTSDSCEEELAQEWKRLQELRKALGLTYLLSLFAVMLVVAGCISPAFIGKVMGLMLGFVSLVFAFVSYFNEVKPLKMRGPLARKLHALNEAVLSQDDFRYLIDSPQPRDIKGVFLLCLPKTKAQLDTAFDRYLVSLAQRVVSRQGDAPEDAEGIQRRRDVFGKAFNAIAPFSEIGDSWKPFFDRAEEELNRDKEQIAPVPSIKATEMVQV